MISSGDGGDNVLSITLRFKIGTHAYVKVI